MTCSRRPRRWLWPALALLLAAGPAAPAEPRYSEYLVKAGFLYNFAKLVEWPADTPAAVSLCLLGEDPFGPAREGIAGKPVGERTLAVRVIDDPAELAGCQIVFVPATQSAHLGAVVQAAATRPVLTVGDQSGLAARGLVAGFYLENDKVRFEINVDAARRAQLAVSSRLLNLARVVRDEAAR